jgi:hypothetical protein
MDDAKLFVFRSSSLVYGLFSNIIRATAIVA